MREQQLDALLSDFRNIADAQMADICLSDEKKKEILASCLEAGDKGVVVPIAAPRRSSRKWAAGLAVAAALMLTVAGGLRLLSPRKNQTTEAAIEKASEPAEAYEYSDQTDAAAEEAEPEAPYAYFGESDAYMTEGLDQPEISQEIITNDGGPMLGLTAPEEAPEPKPSTSGSKPHSSNSSGGTAEDEAPPEDENIQPDQDDVLEAPVDEDIIENEETDEPPKGDNVLVGGGAIVEGSADDEIVEDDAVDEDVTESEPILPDVYNAVAFVRAIPVTGSESYIAIRIADGTTVTDQAAAVSTFPAAADGEEVVSDCEETEYGYIENGWLFTRIMRFTVTRSLWGNVPPNSVITVMGVSAASGLEHALLLKPITNPIIDGVVQRLDLLAQYGSISCVGLPTDAYVSGVLAQLGGNK